MINILNHEYRKIGTNVFEGSKELDTWNGTDLEILNGSAHTILFFKCVPLRVLTAFLVFLVALYRDMSYCLQAPRSP